MKTQLRKAVKNLRGKIKQSDFLFAARRNFIDKDLRRERKNMKHCTVKSSRQIKEELKQYRMFWKCIPHDYIRYGLFNKNLQLEEILDYIPMHYYYCDYYNSIFTPVKSKLSDNAFLSNRYPVTYKYLSLLPSNVFKAIGKGVALDDKLLQYMILKEAGIDVPEVIGVIYANNIYSLNGDKIDFGTVFDRLRNEDKVFLKPTDGCGGTGIVVVENHNGTFKYKQKELKKLSDLELNSAQVYIIQRPLRQIKALAEINSSSVNTLRTIVKYDNGVPAIIGIILRMGRKNSHVDNSHMGGFSVGIDIKTGKFFPSGAPEHGGGIYEAHPDSGYVFDGNGIENWTTVLAQINNIISRIVDFPIIGWDIAITEKGVEAIEFNLGFGIEHAQTILGGLRKPLGIIPHKTDRD